MKRQFKLIKQYPDCNLKLETIITFEEGIEEVKMTPTDCDFDYFYSLSECIKYPEFWKEIQPVLWKTEDGVKIYSLNHPQLWWVHVKTFNIGIDYKNTLNNIDTINYKYFSTEKAAKTYIYLNSPVYSIQDIKNAVQTRYGQWTITTGDDLVLVDLGKLCK